MDLHQNVVNTFPIYFCIRIFITAMSNSPLVRCDPNKRNSCRPTIEDVICSSYNSTNYYCHCHTNYYMTRDYKCSSSDPLVRCDPNKKNSCRPTIEDVICSSYNDTNYCQCHNNYFMTSDYKCSPSDESESVTTTTSRNFGLTDSSTFTSTPIDHIVSISLLGFVALTLCLIIRKVRSHKKNLKNEMQTSNEIKNKIQDNPNYLKMDFLTSIDKSIGETVTTYFPTTNYNSSGIYSYFGNPTENLIHNPSPARIINRNCITDLEKIGEGHFGLVFKGCWRLSMPALFEDDYCCQEVAVKTLKQNYNSEAEEDFWREVDIMSSFHHPNILSLLGVCPRENDAPPLMVFEFMQFGDLKTILQNNSDPFRNKIPGLPILTSENLLSIAHQIANGMEYLAAQKYVHRDLACRNCLVDLTGLDLEVKISDFGLSRDVHINDYYRLSAQLKMLPVRWMSPESILFRKFTIESDIWSYGVVLWEIFNYGKQPYYGYTSDQVLKLITEGTTLDIPQNCPEEVANIMISCWKTELKERLHFPEICRRFSNLRENLKNKNNQIIAIAHETDELSNPNYV